jgi:hypothetical protein
MDKKSTLKETLSAEDYKRISDVRRDVWNGGFQGLALGLTLGAFGNYAIRYIPQMKKYYSRNNMMLSTLVCGALFSFVGSLSAGERL